ncbi:MAG: hypothetical protein FWC50_10880 [Planctomycetaceae bacterium]|nr:hypothetical protein [Planctomycetaceae bacterium]
MNMPPKNTRSFKTDSPLRVVKSAPIDMSIGTPIDTPEAISDRMIRIEAAHKILQHFASSEQIQNRSGANVTLPNSSRLEILEAEHGSTASQGGCARPKAAAHTGCGILEPAVSSKNGLRLFDGSSGQEHQEFPEEKTEPVSLKCVTESTNEKNHEWANGSTTFYKNKTNDFFGKLQEAERLLYKKLHLISKIDFPAQKRRMLHRKVAESGEPETLADVLSDSGVKRVVEPPKSRTKQSENKPEDKLVVEVETFIESFSKMKTPEYRNHLRNESRRKTPLPYEKLFDEIHPKTESKCNMVTATAHAGYGESSQSGGEWDCVSVLPECDTISNNTVNNDIVNNEVCVESGKQTSFSLQIPDSSRPVEVCTESEQTQIARIKIAENISQQSEPPVTENDPAAVEKCSHAEKTPLPVPAVSAIDSPVPTVEPVVKEQAAKLPVELPMEKTNVHEPEQASDTSEKKPAASATFPKIVQRLEELAPEQYDLLAEHIKNKVYDGNRLIAFCGMKRHVGCSTMTLAAARGMTRHGLKTVVIDANFEFPMLGTLLTSTARSVSTTSCWVEVLLGKTNWESIGFSPDDRHLLTILPLSENALTSWSHVEPEELQQKTNRLVADLHEHFDLVMLDCGSFDPEYEEITWGELELFQPDGVVLVRNPKTVASEKMEPYRRDLRACGMEEFGVAENFA